MANAVLLIDDDSHLHTLVELVLRDSSRYRVECVDSTDEALGELDREDSDVILLRWWMDHSGWDFLEERKRVRRRRNRRIPVIVMTSLPIPLSERRKIRRLGVVEIIEMPFKPRELRRALDDALG